eukprot:CAMPEP_0176236598 /NCGR_PEP_ID=MMETSP0121_2-20121125/27422_1 /TAXON_ID=160619 /ORGANISM="Kryptoperidinium foliaceum, Strain CCMP 1326" /LENGTH=185 /DNA_ID=CAMNT_0017576027 /DNA_START=23 /DNA_END=578 /DNA_ORIENTATION=-
MSARAPGRRDAPNRAAPAPHSMLQSTPPAYTAQSVAASATPRDAVPPPAAARAVTRRRGVRLLAMMAGYALACPVDACGAELEDLGQAAAVVRPERHAALDQRGDHLARGRAARVVQRHARGRRRQRAWHPHALLNEALQRPRLRAERRQVRAAPQCAMALKARVALPREQAEVRVAAPRPSDPR